MRAAVLSVALAGCAYRPGTFSHMRADFPGQRTTVGCIDLAIERRPDLSSGGTVLGYRFGNRCDRPAMVDLLRTRVVGRTFAGEHVELWPYDPEGELRPAHLDGRSTGGEAIAYQVTERLAEVCVDAASVVREGAPRWLCFASALPPPEPEPRRDRDRSGGEDGAHEGTVTTAAAEGAS